VIENPVTVVHRPISERQNSDESMELLRADSWFYLRAKFWHAVRLAGTLILALLVPVIVFYKPGWGDLLGALAGVWVLVGRTILIWLEDRSVRMAVTIQEQFDTELFDLEWNSSLAGRRAAREDIHTAAEKVRWKRRLKKLRDWYADADSVAWPLNVLLCQRSSAVWGRRSHYGYAMFVLSLGILWFMAGVVMAVVANATLGAYLITVFLPSQPAFLDTIDLVRGHLQQSKAKAALEEKTTDLWNRGAEQAASVTEQGCREVQDQAYTLRRKGIQIPQLVYWFRRKQDEEAMRAAVAHLVKQQVGGSSGGV